VRALAIASAHGHRHRVLGAWGCGVFGNDPRVVASAFHEALDGPFAGAFDEAVFAVLDGSPERRFIPPFGELFHPGMGEPGDGAGAPSPGST